MAASLVIPCPLFILLSKDKERDWAGFLFSYELDLMIISSSFSLTRIVRPQYSPLRQGLQSYSDPNIPTPSLIYTSWRIQPLYRRKPVLKFLLVEIQTQEHELQGKLAVRPLAPVPLQAHGLPPPAVTARAVLCGLGHHQRTVMSTQHGPWP